MKTKVGTPRARVGRGASTHVARRALVAEIARRIAGGETLKTILQTPGMPYMPTFHQWMLREGELSSIYEAAKEARRRRPVPSNMATARGYCPELGREICARIAMAERLDDVFGQDDMPCETTFYRWLREEPEFAEHYRQAREVQAHRRFEMAWDAACHARWDGWRGARLFIDTIRWQIARMSPAAYGPSLPGELEKRRIEVEVVKFGSDDPPYRKVMTVGEFRELG